MLKQPMLRVFEKAHCRQDIDIITKTTASKIHAVVFYLKPDPIKHHFVKRLIYKKMFLIRQFFFSPSRSVNNFLAAKLTGIF